MDDITRAQQSLARKALAQPEHRFEDVYHLICRDAWVRFALSHVLSNTGSRTAGMDGTTRRKFQSDAYTGQFVDELIHDLKTGTYRPELVRRVYIRKPNGKQRPLGIPTIRDRVVQMLLKMLMEPIWESDFLDCSSGFRPRRRTMDCIVMVHRLANRHSKHYWAVEGDIKGCFDHIHHDILLELVGKRIQDRRVSKLIRMFLEAGIMEGDLFQKTAEGTPQGGIVSPLLVNIYLHELDRYWHGKYGTLTPRERIRRRDAGVGNNRLVRYADDFVILTNGPKAEAERLRDEFKQFLWETLRLELSEEKTLVTHIADGFDFLGFHIRHYEKPYGEKPVTLVKPSAKSIERLKAKIRHMTRNEARNDNPYLKFLALNQVMRGWMQYYRHVNASKIADSLQHWIYRRVLHWLADHHDCGPRQAMSMYQRQEGGYKNLAVKTPKGDYLSLYRMDSVPITRYVDKKRGNPYLEDWITDLEELREIPDLNTDYPWHGSEIPLRTGWADMRIARLEKDGYRCTKCGNTEELDVHHNQQRKWRTRDKEGADWKELRKRNQQYDDLEELRTLCRKCHEELHQDAVSG